MSAWDKLNRKGAAYGRSLLGLFDRGDEITPWYDGYETREAREDQRDVAKLSRKEEARAAHRPSSNDLNSQLRASSDQRERRAQSKKVVRRIVRRATAGDSEAQFMLGMSYLRGDGIEKDRVRAEHWFRRAAEGGYEPAQRRLEHRRKRQRKRKVV